MKAKEILIIAFSMLVLFIAGAAFEYEFLKGNRIISINPILSSIIIITSVLVYLSSRIKKKKQ